MPSIVPLAPSRQARITGLFIAVFDINRGPVLLWSTTVDGGVLDGVENKCFCSGLHAMAEDFVCFGSHASVGLAAFVNARSDSSAERNSRMVVVGALGRELDDVCALAPLLREEATRHAAVEDFAALCAGTIQPDHRALDALWGGGADSPLVLACASGGSPVANEQCIPPLAVPTLLSLLPPTAAPLRLSRRAWRALWRCVLAGLRVLVVGDVPLVALCGAVATIHMLGNGIAPAQLSHALYTVDVNDIDTLRGLDDFVACTTHPMVRDGCLCDVLVERQCVRLASARARRIAWPVAGWPSQNCSRAVVAPDTRASNAHLVAQLQAWAEDGVPRRLGDLGLRAGDAEFVRAFCTRSSLQLAGLDEIDSSCAPQCCRSHAARVNATRG